MKRFLSWLRRPLRNERGEITFFACFFVVGVVMLISFLLLYASVRITCINIRNGAKMELNNLSCLLYTSPSLRFSTQEAFWGRYWATTQHGNRAAASPETAHLRRQRRPILLPA